MFRSRTSYGTFVVGGTRINTLKITYKFVKVVNYNQWRVEELNGRRAKQAIIYKKNSRFLSSSFTDAGRREISRDNLQPEPREALERAQQTARIYHHHRP